MNTLTDIFGNPNQLEMFPTKSFQGHFLQKTTTPKVSVIIPVYNSAKYIQTALKSVFNQTYTNYEIIIIDDGSTDDTREQLKPYQDKIRYFYQENQGSAAARNLGIKLAKGELIAFLDSDDYWLLSEKLEKQVSCFQENPSLGCINTGWRIVDGEGKHIKTVQPWHKAPKLDLETWLKKKCVRTSAMVFRREWLEKVGGFDEELRQSHDVDLILRLSLAGCETDWLKEETVCYRQHEENTTKNSLKQAKYVQAVLDKFFSRDDLPGSISKQESQIRYHTLVWIAWYQYRASNLDEMANFLQKSLDFSPYLRVENISHWLTSFQRFSKERGEDFDVDSLTNSLQWQQLMTLTLGLKNVVADNIFEKPQSHENKKSNNNPIQNLEVINSNILNIETQVNSKQAMLREKIEPTISSDMTVEDYRKLGEEWKKQGKLDQTVVLYGIAVERVPNNHKLYRIFGDALREYGQIDRAIVAYEKSIQLNSKFAWSYQGLGKALELKGRYSEAISAYEKAIEIKPTIFKDVYNQLSTLLNREARWNEAISLHESALKLHAHKPKLRLKIYEKLADTFIIQQNWEQACVNLVKVLHIKPDYFSAYEKIADILEKQGKPIVPAADATTPSTYCELPQDFLENYCNLPKDWLVDLESDPSIKLIPVCSSSQTIFLSTKTLEDNDIPECMQTQVVNLAQAFIAVVLEGRAWADRVMSGVITKDNKILADTHSGPVGLILSSEELPSPEYIDGTVAFLSVRWGHRGYFHWICDVLARIELLRLGGIDLNSIDKFVINKFDQQFQIETFAHLGIPREKIIESLEIPHIQAKTLIVPSLPQLRAYRDTAWASQALKRSFLNPEDLKTFNKVERIYINRLDAPHRRVVNEDKVIEFLESWGFTSIALESMSFSEQVLCMASAKVIVAVHGAGLSNLVFCNPETKIIEIFSPAHVQNTYWRISNACGLDHYHLMSDDTDPNVNLSERSVKRDVCVNLDDLTKLFLKAGLNPPVSTQETYKKTMRLVSNNCVLYRILGNDLPPRHSKEQTLENLKFILDNEQTLNNCEKRWVVNRIVDRQQEQAIIELLEKRNQNYIHIPFIEEEYSKTILNYEGFPEPDYLNSEEFHNLPSWRQERAKDHIYHYKNLYAMNNNGARNTALREGKNLAKWILPWDGNCFLTQKAWQEILDGIHQFQDSKYFIVPMARILSNNELLDPNFRPDANEEPQIIFRQDSMEEFDERTVRYGHFSKIELFWRLGVPGKWSQWKQDPWDKKGRKTSCESGQFETIGWVARLFSGKKHLEENSKERNESRMQSIWNLLDHLDERVNSKKKMLSGN